MSAPFSDPFTDGVGVRQGREEQSDGTQDPTESVVEV